MDNFIEKLVFAARDEDINSWVNILFVVILALFWVIGGIIKGKVKKTREMEEKSISRGPRRPGGYPKGLRKELKESLGQPSQVSTEEPPRRRPYYQQQKQARKEIPRNLPYIHKGPAPIRAAKEKPPEPSPQISELDTPTIDLKPQIEYLTEAMLDLTDPDDIKKAILHYEIIGKPLSLRDSFERIV